MTTTKKIAVVGAGPAGIYFADAMSRLDPSARIDVLERLPFPYGLVRYGVAADHQGTKSVTQILARAMRRPNVRYYGGVEIGRDLSLAELDQIYDAVVLATGASRGRTVEFPAEDDCESVCAFDLARWLNGYPGLPPFSRKPLRSVAIIGNGNVALDMVRLLAKPANVLARLDLSTEGVQWLQSNALEQIDIIGRGRAGETRFSVAELGELAQLEYFQPLPEQLDLLECGETRNNGALEVLRRFSVAPVRDARPIRFHFGCVISRYERGALHVLFSGKPRKLAADLVIHAVGQHAGGLPGIGGGDAREGIEHSNGVVSGRESTFAVGWAMGAGRGTIPESRGSAQAVAQLVAAAACKPSGSEREASLERILNARVVRYVSWDAWQRIDRSEIELGRMSGKIRHKYQTASECADAIIQSSHQHKLATSIREPAS
ncbi:FAD-dependent oxidoreductase [Bradyrhizobium sp. LjRoot220]|uniref:FAD-dependent oxidoreductase n=1 Tax=Bradyrhizobium sp. LjRoot220 TaxID=3342284 RepID=UPI003ED05F25